MSLGDLKNRAFKASTDMPILVIIILCGIVFHLLPFFATSISLDRQLLSDVEFHISAWQIAQNPDVFVNDTILSAMIETLPAGQVISGRLLTHITGILKIDLFLWSVLLSFVSLILFLTGLYLLILYSLRDRLSAFMIAFLSIIPVHALGAGATFGFRPLGFLVRDLALVLIILILILYFRGIRRENTKYIALAFFSFGILANLYPSYSVMMAMVLFLADILRTKKIGIRYIWYCLIFLAGAFPALFDILTRHSRLAPVDMDIMRSYYGYMMAHPLSRTGMHYLRRFIAYAFSNFVLYLLVFRQATEDEKKMIRPFYAIAISSFLFSIFGVYIESNTAFARYLPSRASVWFTLASMAITVFGVKIFFRRHFKKFAGILTFVAVSIVFLGQSNFVTYCRFLQKSHSERVQKKEFHIAVKALKDMTNEGDVILAPSEEFYDWAASVRTYSYRPIYVCYKYGGVSIMNGEVAREWLGRHSEVSEIFEDFDSRRLIDLMNREKIRYAFLPVSYFSQDDLLLKDFIALNTGHFIIIKTRDRYDKK